jgi:acyl-CoA synthetase (AMP-forming)/AMP-acid ligase II
VTFEYHNEPEKTAESYNEQGWATTGDVGYVDEEGYLYLTDRKHFTIISGGVNIYPQEVENLLINHDKVADVAVFGVPNEEFGEEVQAVVQPQNWADATDEVAFELMEWLRERVSHLKVPKAPSISASSCRAWTTASSTSVTSSRSTAPRPATTAHQPEASRRCGDTRRRSDRAASGARGAPGRCPARPCAEVTALRFTALCRAPKGR